MQNWLRERGHQVAECATAEQALALYAATPFSLLLIDWVLPTLDGLSLCRRIRALSSAAQSVIVMVTSRSGANQVAQGLQAGADDYITKPIDPALFHARMAIAERLVHERSVHTPTLTGTAPLGGEWTFQALIESSRDGTVIHRDGLILYANPSFGSIVGYGALALRGMALASFVHAQDTTAAHERWRAAASGQLVDGKPHELRFVRGDRKVAACEETLVRIPFEGGGALASLVRSVEDRKRFEEHLFGAERMTAIGTLAAGIAHEINNPLSYLMANLRFIQDEIGNVAELIPSDSLRTLQELLAQADDGAERVRVIISDLKSYSRADTSTESPIDLEPVLDSAIHMAWSEIRHRAELEKRFDTVAPVRGSAARLAQAFVNLLLNAAQAIPLGHAREHRIRVVLRQVDQRVIVEISDTGNGIAAEDLPHVFDPFFTTKAVGVGTGLGLSVCQNIITNCGGQITIESLLSRGTTVRIDLPATRPTLVRAQHKTQPMTFSLPALPESTSMSPPNEAARRVLIIDDEPGVVRSLQRSLSAHHVTCALSGREALEIFESGQVFDVVLCDVMMANISGVELYEVARQRFPGLERRFVFVTGGAFTPQTKAFLAGIENQVIEKPFNIKHLQRVVQAGVT